MASIAVRKRKVLLDAVTTAGPSGDITGTDKNPSITEPILVTDHRYKETNERCFVGTLTSGDTLQIQVKLSVEDSWYTIATITSTEFGDVLRGPWPYIRVEKFSENGPATFIIQG